MSAPPVTGTKRPRRGATALCVLLQAGAIAWVWRPLLSGRHSPFERDIEFYHHPVTRELVEAWSAGRVPLWTDHVYAGFPYFADAQTAAWYPGTLLVAGLGPHHGYVLFLWIHALLAAASMLWLVRAHGGGLVAAFAAGLVVPLSGFFAYETQHPGLFAILTWLPLWLVATRAVFRRPSSRRIALGALPLAMMVFAGTLQVLFGSALLFAGYVVGLCFEAWRTDGRRAAVSGVAAVAAAQTLSLLLAAVVLLPTFAHFPMTARALGMDYAFASTGSVHPLRLLGMFVAGIENAAGGGLDLGPDFADAPLQVGVLVLPLALLGLRSATAGRRLALALGVAALLLAVVAAGRHGGLHPFLYALMPGAVGALRGMGRAIGPLVVCLALLAGLGLHRVGEPGARRALVGWLLAAFVLHALVLLRAPEAAAVPGAALLAVAIALCLALRRRQALLRASLAALVAVDLVFLGAAHDVLAAKPPPPDARRLDGVHLFPSLAEIAAGRYDAGGEGGSGAGERVLMLGFGAANFTFHHGLDGLGGYNPLVTLQYLDFASLANHGHLQPREPLRGYVHPIVPGRPGGLLDASSARFLISAQPLRWEGLRLLARHGPHPRTGRPVLLYENPRALPRAYLAYRTRRADRPEALERWLGPGFDARRTTVFEGDAEPLDGPARIDPLRVTRSTPERLHFDVSSERDALLVLTDAWYPGWRARVDGAEAPVLRVNAHFRGVALPAGARRVELVFEPWTFRVGAAVSLAAFVGLALLAAAPRFLRPRGI